LSPPLADDVFPVLSWKTAISVKSTSPYILFPSRLSLFFFKPPKVTCEQTKSVPTLTSLSSRSCVEGVLSSISFPDTCVVPFPHRVSQRRPASLAVKFFFFLSSALSLQVLQEKNLLPRVPCPRIAVLPLLSPLQQFLSRR